MMKQEINRSTFRKPWFSRDRAVQSMEAFQDVIVLLLCLELLLNMTIKLWGVYTALLAPVDFQGITSEILLLLILVELFRLLIIYLQQRSIAVGVAVEVSIVSVLREVIVEGALHLTWDQMLAICGLILSLAVLLYVCSRTPHMDVASPNPQDLENHNSAKSRLHEMTYSDPK